MADALFPSSSHEPSIRAAAPVRSKSPARWIVPLVLFMAIVGGIAWVVQNMPPWRAPQQRPAAALSRGQGPLMVFIHPYNKQGFVQALWEVPNKSEKPYAREFERNTKGRYLFPFVANSDHEVEIGLAHQGCDCSQLHVASITKQESEALVAAVLKDPGAEPAENPAWTWRLLEKSDDQGVTVAGGGFAVLRITWSHRRPAGESLNLSARFWARQGNVKQQDYGIQVPAASALPLRVLSDRANVGILEPGGVGKAEFVLWSPTRADAKLLVPEAGADPLVAIDVKSFNQEECAGLQAKLRKEEISTKVYAAWRVGVIVKENQGDRFLDQGHFLRHLSIQLADVAEELPPLTITGLVKGLVEVGGLENQGKINLKSFAAENGTKTMVYLWTDPKTGLTLKSAQPAALDVKLLESFKEKPANKRKWELHVVVPPNQVFGTIADDSAILLQADSKPPRLIRIPLVGNAVQS